MASTVDGAFGQFDENLNLDPAQRLSAEKWHNDIRQVLQREIQAVVGSFLQGSFARKTMLKPLKDVDIVLLLDEEIWPEIVGPDGPAIVMATFRQHVQAAWPDARFDQAEDGPAGKALRVDFDHLDFSIDLVPALQGPGEYVRIGDRHERRWITSNTRIQKQRVAARNVATGGKFVHQVRMVKAIVRNAPTLDLIKGIVIESLTYHHVTTSTRHADAVARVLMRAADDVAGPVIEPAGEDDVTAKWNQAERATAVRVLRELGTRAAEALDLEEQNDTVGAIGVWSDLAGSDFPKPPTRSEADVMTAWAAGSLTSSGHPSRTRAGATSTPPGRAWRSS